ncbi:MAG: nickel superoxide dismutase [Crocinitomix sp.]|jgi:nickel superoxide dismutase
MKITASNFILLTFAFLFSPNKSFSHCQVPCGIFEDSLRIQLIDEHITTVEKAMTEIAALSNQENTNYNQIVRWVNNKEIHATKIQTIVSDYFLYQRIKPAAVGDHHYAGYMKNLKYLHQLSVYAMKAKQAVNLDVISKMRQTLQGFTMHYFSEHKH